MKNKIFSLNELVNDGKKIARLAANRNLNEKAVKDKMKSLKENGLLQAAIVVDATTALEQGLKLADFVTGEAVTSENASNYLALTEGNHRYQAHLNLLEKNNQLKKGEEPYKGEFYFMYPLGSSNTIAKTLVEMNVCTRPWKGGDYASGAKMMVTEKLEVLDVITEYTQNGYSLDAASKWATLNPDISKKVMTDAMNGNISDKLRNITNIETAQRIHQASLQSFGKDFLKGRLLPDWIIKQIRDAPMEESKAETIEKLITFLSGINADTANEIKTTKGVRGGDTKETLINRKLSQLYAA